VAASYETATLVRLTFDRPINAAGIVAGQMTVDDGPFEGRRFVSTAGVDVVDPVTIDVALIEVGMAAGADVILTAGAGTGIVAVDDGGTWDGVTDLVLPFGPQ
jgi:hypothetical protein